MRKAELGPNSSTLVSYLERNGAPKCPSDANPAEWMLESTAPGEGALDWFGTWRSSSEYKEVQAELQRLRDRANRSNPATEIQQVDASQHREFVAPITVQYWEVFKRTATHYWRSPTYIYSKASLAILSVSGLGPSCPCAEKILTVELLVSIYRLQLQCHQHTPGFTKPTLRILYVPSPLWQLKRADHAVLRTPARRI
jgi:hypothetical protein